MTQTAAEVLRSVRVQWCSDCGRLRQFLRGVCVMTPWHLGTCPDCPRPTTGGVHCDSCDPDAAADAVRDRREEAAMDAAEWETDPSW